MPAIPFTKANVDAAPASAGVYFLYEAGALVYIGRAQGESVTIRSRLQDHYAGRAKPGTQQATAFGYEETKDAKNREVAWMEWYKARNNGKLPKYNERVG